MCVNFHRICKILLFVLQSPDLQVIYIYFFISILTILITHVIQLSNYHNKWLSDIFIIKYKFTLSILFKIDIINIYHVGSS